MNIAEIESRLREVVERPFDPESFVFDFLGIFENIPKSTITKLRQGASNKAQRAGDVLLKNKIFFRPAPVGKAGATLDALGSDPLATRHAPQFVMATDGIEFHCRDTKVDQTLDVPFAKLNDAFDFFLPLAGFEHYEGVAENPADIKATGRLAKLYDAILEANPDWATRDHTHELNLFMTRLLFCFFAEDTAIFDKGLFTQTVMNFTNDDGANAAPLLAALFAAMDTPPDARGSMHEYLRRFPWVNGGLFRDRTPIPKLSRRARRLLRECGELQWQEINPDIFGSMIQAVVEPGLRGDMGMHYTSVPNIMKVLQPLFLMPLEEEFDAAWDNEARLKKLLERIYRIRVFDPACGSGNFLIIAYRELRKLENRIFGRLREVAKQWALPMTGVKLDHFFGIELADFAAETAKLSLWIAEYQANEQFKAMFGTAPPILPLKEGGNVVQGNAARVDWNQACLSTPGTELYIVGNPPYLGGKKLSPSQSEDMDLAGLGKMKQVDYIGCWFVKAVEHATKTGGQIAFVTTDSVCQGEQVHLLWSHIFNAGFDISFAYETFKWSNNASKNAVVACTIIGLKAQTARRAKFIYTQNHGRAVKNISPYLIEGGHLLVKPESMPISPLPQMCMGSNPVDGKHLILTKQEYEGLLNSNPEAEPFVRRYMGGDDFLYGIERFCLWIDEATLVEAMKVPFIAMRIESCRAYRQTAGRDARKVADRPYRFCYRSHQNAPAIVYPNTSAESRRYIPGGFTDEKTVINHAAFAIYDPPPWVLGILSSTLHRVWLAVVGGSLEMRYRYSVKLVYNTYPVPMLSEAQQLTIESHVWHIIERRERHPGETIASLYDPDTMPKDLLEAHQDLDNTLEHIYLGRPFRNDTERLEHLFKLYATKIKKGAI